jgi:DNA-binding transcriptional LysR family regulator
VSDVSVDLRALRYVVTLAEELHFGRAAQRHFISAQPFGQRISALERELGYALFERTSRRVSLTPRGELFVLRAMEVLSRFDELTREQPPVDDATLVVGALGYGLGWPFDAVMAALREVGPGIRVIYRELDMVTQFLDIRAGEVDAAFVLHTGPVDGLALDLISSQARTAVVPARSELAEAGFLRAADLEGQRWVPMAARDRGLREWLGPETYDGRWGQGIRQPESVPAAVAATGAIAVSSIVVARVLPRADVRHVLLEGPVARAALATREDDDRPAVRAFRRAVATAFREHRTLVR